MIKDLKFLVAAHTKSPTIYMSNSEGSSKKRNSTPKRQPALRIAIEKVASFISAPKSSSRPSSAQGSPHTPTTPPTQVSPITQLTPAADAAAPQRLRNSTSPRPKLGPSLPTTEAPSNKRRKSSSLPVKKDKSDM